MFVHPNSSTFFEACNDIAEELERCRGNGFFAKYFGGCNDLKEKLIICLRKEVSSNYNHSLWLLSVVFLSWYCSVLKELHSISRNREGGITRRRKLGNDILQWNNRSRSHNMHRGMHTDETPVVACF